MDFQNTPRHMSEDNACHKSFLKKFMQRLELQREFGLHDPLVWLWISENAERATTAIAYAQLEMRGYVLKIFSYQAAKNKQLYDCKRAVEEVHILFLIKKGSNVNLKSVKEYYIVPNLPYYTITRQYKEAKFRINSMELRMEFYLELVQEFCKLGDGIYKIFKGTKFMIACRIRILHRCFDVLKFLFVCTR